ncbi:MAG: alcohol dehydrogenase catalytic domain-containing protein [Lachnospiraceae bacterium]|nr:alcohol dehydrogenase catalytic domain-containing protein [Lachnospiraceae bacterium]
MRQIVMTGPSAFEIEDRAIPAIRDDQLLVRVKYCGVCHSELQSYKTAGAGALFGHEPMGIVEKAGKSVSGFKPGDRVTGTAQGSFADYVAMDARAAVRIPDHIADEDAVVEPLGCLVSASSKMMPSMPGDSIAVVGCGYMGCGMISLFRLLGYGRIVAVDPRAFAREHALKMGADEAYSPAELPDKYLNNWKTMGGDLLSGLVRGPIDVFGPGFDNVMEFSGTQEGLALAGDMVKAHGRLGIGGFHNDGMRTIDYKLWNFKAFTSVNCHERRADFGIKCANRAMELLASGRWDAMKGQVTHVFPMEDFALANTYMETHPDGFVKGLLRMDPA